MTEGAKPVLTGGCQCGAIRFAVSAAPTRISICHCRMCQKASGAPFASLADIEHENFSWTRGTPAAFKSSSIAERDFCAACGTHVLSRAPGVPGAVLLKVGTFDDPSLFGGPQMVIFTIDKQSFHHLPEGVPAFERTPG